jgi:DNA invertase Pin-like site-specific DNA recombinase
VTSWGYARVSTVDQDAAPQFDALRRAGIDGAGIVVVVDGDPELVCGDSPPQGRSTVRRWSMVLDVGISRVSATSPASR